MFKLLIKHLGSNVGGLKYNVKMCLSSRADLAAQELLNQIYNSVRSQRFKDIVVIQTKFDADPRYLILATAFNPRHLVSGTEMINKEYKNQFKKPNQDFARLSIAQEWNVLDFSSVIVHLFASDCRKHFDIEQLWTVGKEFDDLTNFPPVETTPEEQRGNPVTLQLRSK